MTEIDSWREQVLALLSSAVEPVGVLLLLIAFSLGLYSVKAID